MDHADIRRKLSAYLENDVSAEEKLEIKKHLGTCGICRGALADLELTLWHLKRLPEVEPPPWLSEKILAKILAPSEPKPGLGRRFFSPLRVKLLVGLVILSLLGIVGYFVSRKTRPEEILPAPAPSVSHEAAPPSPQMPIVPRGPSAMPAPQRATPSPVAPSLSGMPSAVQPPSTEVPPSVSSPAPAATPPPPLPQHQEPELRPAEETALPEKEAVQPFGQEEQSAPQEEKR